ncbi:MAG: HDOD domain-containing protein [Halopseudomonas yangmingensis]|uniref:HD-like signal output (HDOD) domain, no enzymatic activity n=1 Tax=Halopseudomonas yangmingensis TaxID=1720063 RepID=A0A1I4P7V7_9GAMM|nr:HDOD domain-containing protein [Halopseudomonas yangmingensis]SFM23944.1 HD-like signal output (HDOD) domain, no enzymatic activity [Halopseudomonas yangmingensis]
MSAELTEEQIKRALQGIRVPPQPQIMVDLQMEQMMPEPDMRNIARLISQDPGLSGSLLKIVNSPFFGLSNRITSIQQAVNLLGIARVVNIVNAQSIRSQLSDDNILKLNRFWDNAQDVAATCMTLAKQLGCTEPDEAYALGLFHNCGIPLMFSRFDNYIDVLETSYHSPGKRIVDVENLHLNTNHAVVGYFTAKSWLLPPHLCEAIANHHNARQLFIEDRCADIGLKNRLAILKMAEHICRTHQILGGGEQDHEWEDTGDAILDYIGLTDYDFETLRDNCREMLSSGTGHQD